MYKYIRKLMALPFLPHRQISPMFLQLQAEAETEPLQNLVTYIRRQWIESTVFLPRNWSVYQQAIRQPRSQGLSSYRLGRARRDPGLVWSRATVTIENIREGSSVIRQFVALSFVALSRHRHHTRYLKEVFGLEFRTVSIPTFI